MQANYRFRTLPVSRIPPPIATHPRMFSATVTIYIHQMRHFVYTRRVARNLSRQQFSTVTTQSWISTRTFSTFTTTQITDQPARPMPMQILPNHRLTARAFHRVAPYPAPCSGIHRRRYNNTPLPSPNPTIVKREGSSVYDGAMSSTMPIPSSPIIKRGYSPSPSIPQQRSFSTALGRDFSNTQMKEKWQGGNAEDYVVNERDE